MKKNKIKISEIITNILLVFSIFIFICSMVTFFKHSENPEDAFLFGYKPIYIKTGSMEPTLKVNGLAVIKKIDYDNVEIDDIIMYTIDDKMITHRVIDITDEGIRTQGDNNPVQDTYFLQPENIKGKVVLIINGTATVVSEIGTPKGIIKWVVIPIACVAILAISVNLIKKIVKEDNEEETIKKKSSKNDTKTSKAKDLDNEETATILSIDIDNIKSQDYDENLAKSIKFLADYFTWDNES